MSVDIQYAVSPCPDMSGRRECPLLFIHVLRAPTTHQLDSLTQIGRHPSACRQNRDGLTSSRDPPPASLNLDGHELAPLYRRLISENCKHATVVHCCFTLWVVGTVQNPVQKHYETGVL